MRTNPWRFASKHYDPETGFSYFLNRYYSPNLGRWTTPDPIGFADEPNIYAYVHNNPMTRFDLYGLYMMIMPLPQEEMDELRDKDFAEIIEYTMMKIQEPWNEGFTPERCGKLFQNIHDTLLSMGAPGARNAATAVQGAGQRIAQFFKNLFNGTKQARVNGSLELSAQENLSTTTKKFVDSFQNFKSSKARPANLEVPSVPRAEYYPHDPITGKPLPLPRNKYGVDIPSSDTPHTQIGWRQGRNGDYIQTREWGYDGKQIKTTDWTDHGRPDMHSYNPHDHPFLKNSTGGTYKREKEIPFTITNNKKDWEK